MTCIQIWMVVTHYLDNIAPKLGFEILVDFVVVYIPDKKRQGNYPLKSPVKLKHYFLTY